MTPHPVKKGQVWRKRETSRPGRSVRERMRHVEVLQVTPEQISPYARIRDCTLNRVSWIKVTSLERQWDLLEGPSRA